MIGRVFGHLTIKKRSDVKINSRAAVWVCECKCGNERLASTGELNAGRTHSCGCVRRAGKRIVKHGLTATRTYRVWATMLARCRTPSQTSYKNYGGRGIRVCERWNLFENFLADMGESLPGKEIDRIDNDGDYDPGNCRWVSPKENGRNKRNNIVLSYNGQSKFLLEWSAILKIPITTLYARIRIGWPTDKVLGTPLDKNKSNGRKKWWSENANTSRSPRN